MQQRVGEHQNPWNNYFRTTQLSSVLADGRRKGVIPFEVQHGDPTVAQEQVMEVWGRLEEIYFGLMESKDKLLNASNRFNYEEFYSWARRESKRLNGDNKFAPYLLWLAWLAMERILGYGSMYVVSENELVPVELDEEGEAVDSDNMLDFIADDNNWIDWLGDAEQNLRDLGITASRRIEKRIKQFQQNAAERAKFDAMRGVVFEKTMKIIQESFIPQLEEMFPERSKAGFPVLKMEDKNKLMGELDGWYNIMLRKYGRTNRLFGFQPVMQYGKSILQLFADGVLGYMSKIIVQSLSLWFMDSLRNFGYSVYWTPQLGKVEWNLYDMLVADESVEWTQYMRQRYVPISELYDLMLESRWGNVPLEQARAINPAEYRWARARRAQRPNDRE